MGRPVVLLMISISPVVEERNKNAMGPCVNQLMDDVSFLQKKHFVKCLPHDKKQKMP